MTLLDDARRLAAADVLDLECACQLCGERVEPAAPSECYREAHTTHGPHAPDCPVLALPRIVAALEAAECVLTVLNTEPKEDQEVLDDLLALKAALEGGGVALSDQENPTS